MYHPDKKISPKRINKILFLNSSNYLNRKYANAVRLPNGSLSLSHYILEKLPKIKIELIDLETKNSKYNLVRDIEKINPDIVCISINATSLWPISKKIISLIKRNISAIIIVGGVHPTADPLNVLHSCSDIDILGWGLDGEELLYRILKLLKKGGYLSDIGKNQIYFRNGLKKDGEIIKSFHDEKIETNLTTLKINDVRRFISFKDYNLIVEGWKGKTISTWCSRGCCFSCFYCLESTWKFGLKQKSVDQRIRDVEFIKNNYFKSNELVQIYYVEDMGTGNPSDFKNFCKGILHMKKKDKSLRNRIFFRCQTRAEFLMNDPEIIPLMAKAGFSDVYIGVEDANPDVLNACNKNLDLNLVEKAVKKLQLNGIRVRLLMIVGLPYQTEKHMARTLLWLKKVRGNRVQASPFKPYPGSVFGNNPCKYGIKIIDKDYSNWDIFSGKDKSGVWEQQEQQKPIYKSLWLDDPLYIYKMAKKYEAVPKKYPPLYMGNLVYDENQSK